jgi:hypothetical protein
MGLRHRQLEKEGWVRQFVADGPLAKHAVETLVAVFQGGPKGGRKPWGSPGRHPSDQGGVAALAKLPQIPCWGEAERSGKNK